MRWRAVMPDLNTRRRTSVPMLKTGRFQAASVPDKESNG